jgi:hypothetical protein
MSTNNIKISELNNIAAISTEDFFPVVHSASMTTYNASIATISPLMTASIYATYSVSASYASFASASTTASYAFQSISASYSSRSFLCETASYFDFSLPNTIPPFASASFSSSWASSSISASYASRSFLCETASYFNFTLPNTTPPFASASISSSWASSSISSSYLLGNHEGPTTGSVLGTASYAITASYLATSAVGNFIKAYGTILMATASYFPSIFSTCSYNISSVITSSVQTIGTPHTPPLASAWEYPFQMSSIAAVYLGVVFIVQFDSPMPSKYYTVVYTTNGFEPYGWEGINVYYTPSGQTQNGFTMSFQGGDNSNNEGKFITNFMVLHP